MRRHLTPKARSHGIGPAPSRAFFGSPAIIASVVTSSARWWCNSVTLVAALQRQHRLVRRKSHRGWVRRNWNRTVPAATMRILRLRTKPHLHLTSHDHANDPPRARAFGVCRQSLSLFERVYVERADLNSCSGRRSGILQMAKVADASPRILNSDALYGNR